MKNYYIKIFYSLFAVLLFGIQLQAQTTKIRGKITDKATNEAIPFVNIVLKGTTAGTISDFKGEYFLETKAVSDSLTLSCLGYLPTTVAIIKQSFQTIDIEMEQLNTQLNEVVVLPGENPAHVSVEKRL
ncbi:MAG: carboxypeptidase-like regulatory domain-containing protein [Bacteroidetes bacterium]|nr:carboxypeptidase-like regulatory domain-containing protein [Bacteroidota bacterium]